MTGNVVVIKLYYIQIAIVVFLCSVTISWADADHGLFEQVLVGNVVDGEVNYLQIAENESFEKYLQQLAKPQSSQDKSEQLAYWINAYNAFAIKGILDGRSPSTFLGRIGYFKKAKYEIAGRNINLYDLERDIIIPYGEPRIHFAINCASASCPKLFSKVYTAQNLEQQLEKSAYLFIGDESRNRFDQEKKVAHLSKIFDWFEKDFKDHSGSVQKYIAQYVEDPELAVQLKNEEYRIKYMKYDWGLNGTAPR